MNDLNYDDNNLCKKKSNRSNADVALYDSWKLLYDCLTVTLSSSIHLRVLRSIYTKRYILDQG